MRILAFAATNSTTSINRQLLEYAERRLTSLVPIVEIEFLDLNEYEMPIYSPEREKADGVHPLAQVFYDKIGAADALLVSFAEYNGFVTAAWKNIFDWMSRIDAKVWQDKPMVILAASPGARAGSNVLASQELLAPFFGGDLKGKYGVGNWKDVWNGKTLTRPEDLAGVDEALMGYSR
ncbi:NAD(P)H-dependent oxidoreductase [Cognatiyoonia sp. IB215446]|uniref:NADPH-dependent FMN reductase n=1 Tax=Cognatiyoonia sp. IB215446 TaxID=3097355 RepID=UPI002A0B5071|nr:NAD(P)H-dependent oxidoreductase [Cognatiyoonia sp. IB215446]MDX8348598.1 NAD(P)H-dependent oxidoreductase [Cognatiyoonia sp. IB215446]